jgi:signal transduction histidine kinase
MEDNVDKSLQSNLSRIQRAVERISHQTEDVLDFVNVTKLQYGLHSIEHVIRSTVLNMIIPDKIKIDISKEDSIIPCDAYKLEIVFGNLINNACYAIPQGGEISIKVIDEEDDLIIKMQDSGKGIPEDIIGKIFDPLFTTKQIGTGLGLASCQSIIEAHGGKITVKNNPTTFTIRLPKHPNNYQLPAKKEFAIRKEIAETN